MRSRKKKGNSSCKRCTFLLSTHSFASHLRASSIAVVSSSSSSSSSPDPFLPMMVVLFFILYIPPHPLCPHTERTTPSSHRFNVVSLSNSRARMERGEGAGRGGGGGKGALRKRRSFRVASCLRHLLRLHREGVVLPHTPPKKKPPQSHVQMCKIFFSPTEPHPYSPLYQHRPPPFLPFPSSYVSLPYLTSSIAVCPLPPSPPPPSLPKVKPR